MARSFLLVTRVCQPLLQLSGKKSAPNDNVKIGYYSIFLLSNDRKRSYESIGIVIYWYRSIVKKWLTPLQKVARFKLKLHGLTVQLSVFVFFIFFGRRNRKQSAGFFYSLYTRYMRLMLDAYWALKVRFWQFFLNKGIALTPVFRVLSTTRGALPSLILLLLRSKFANA